MVLYHVYHFLLKNSALWSMKKTINFLGQCRGSLPLFFSAYISSNMALHHFVGPKFYFKNVHTYAHTLAKKKKHTSQPFHLSDNSFFFLCLFPFFCLSCFLQAPFCFPTVFLCLFVLYNLVPLLFYLFLFFILWLLPISFICFPTFSYLSLPSLFLSYKLHYVSLLFLSYLSLLYFYPTKSIMFLYFFYLSLLYFHPTNSSLFPYFFVSSFSISFP